MFTCSAYVYFEGTLAHNKNEMSAIQPSINICPSDGSLGLQHRGIRDVSPVYWSVRPPSAGLVTEQSRPRDEPCAGRGSGRCRARTVDVSIAISLAAARPRAASPPARGETLIGAEISEIFT